MSMFGERCRVLRKEQKVSQRFLAEELGVSKATITMWEINQREPSFDMAARIADYFDGSLDYLIGRTSIRDWHRIPTPSASACEGADSVRKSDTGELTPQEIEALRRMLAGAQQ